MAKEILIIGASGTGKSTSMRNLPPEETFILNVSGKSLPFKGKYELATKERPNGNMFVSDNATEILTMMKRVSEARPEVKYLIIDDFQYIMSNEYVRRAKENGYNKFQDIGQNIFNIVNLVKQLRDDLFVIFMMHEEHEIDSMGKRIVKAKTIGKMIDQYINLEGMFSVVLYTEVIPNEKTLDYKFRTQTTGNNTGKSPLGMFDGLYTSNDLKFVTSKVTEFYQ